jgi:hypothetical protein
VLGPAPATDLRQVFTAACGNAVGELCEDAAMVLGCTTQLEVHLVDGGARAEGHCDIYDPKEKRVIDIKLVGESSWEMLVKDKAPNPEHVVQVNGYAVGLMAPEWSLYYLRGVSIFERGELQWKAFHGQTNTEAALKIPSRWAALKTLISLGVEPEIPKGYSRERFPCGWCGHQDYCFPERKAA